MHLFLLLLFTLSAPGWSVDVAPQACPMCVPLGAGQAALFGRAEAAGTLGILAHNYLSGVHFYELQPGDALTLDYPDGRRAGYIVTTTSAYRRSQGALCQEWRCYTDDEVFAREYAGGLVLQTCIGDGAGLYFVHAAETAAPPAANGPRWSGPYWRPIG